MATATQPHSIQLLHNATGMPHGLGLLTTVASLPPKYRSRYLNIKTKCEIPLDLSVKPPSPQIANDVPIATTFTEVYTEAHTVAQMPVISQAPQRLEEPQQQLVEEIVEVPTSDQMHVVAHEEIVISQPVSNVIMTTTSSSSSAASTATLSPPLSPLAKRKLHEVDADELKPRSNADYANPTKMAKTGTHATIKRDTTPSKPIKLTDTAPRTSKPATAQSKPTRNKATRKLKFDEETSSPVSGTIIRPLEDITDGTQQYSNGDIDPKYNIVEITEETKAELAAIKNVIGDYVCKLCRIKFDDAFGLARHRCQCIVLLEYRCPECGKQFNCPANLASHRRWHKPKASAAKTSSETAKKENRNTTNQQQQREQEQAQPAAIKLNEELAFACGECGKKFKRQAYLRKHQQTHAKNKENVQQKPQQQQQQQPPQSEPAQPQQLAIPATTTITGTFQATPYAAVNSNKYDSYAASSASSTHSYTDEGVYVSSNANGYDYDADSMSDCSSTSSSTAGYGRLQIVEHGFTEEESIAAAALTNLRNCASVIQHTTATLAH